MPDGVPWKTASAAVDGGVDRAVVVGARPPAAAAARAIATASAAELPSPARDGMRRVGVEVERRRLQPRARSPPARARPALPSPADASRPQAGTRSAPAARRAPSTAIPTDSPAASAGVPVHDRVLADEDHLAVAERRGGMHRGAAVAVASSRPLRQPRRPARR